MSSGIKDNPFAALFESSRSVHEFVNKNKESSQQAISELASEEFILERIFLISTRPNGPYSFPLLVLEDVGNLELSNLDSILFERLLLSNLHNYLKGNSDITSGSSKQNKNVEFAVRPQVLIYLNEVYSRSKQEQNEKIKTAVYASIVCNMKTVLLQPDIIQNQDIHHQFCNILLNEAPSSKTIGELVLNVIHSLHEDNELPTALLNKVLHDAKERLKTCSIMGVDWPMISVFDFYASSPALAPLLLKPLPWKNSSAIGRHYSQTILGSILSISCLPMNFGDKCEFFENPSRQQAQTHKATEISLGVAQKGLQNRIYLLFLSLLKVSPEAKDLLLKWIEHCLVSNSGRAGLWHIQAEELRAMTFVSDGFMINLCSVLIQLSLPFVKDISESSLSEYKIMKVDPSYCSPMTERKKNEIKGVYNGDLHKQTPMIPIHDAAEEPSLYLNDQYSFMTTCFYLTHRSLHLGLHTVIQKLNKLSQELSRMQGHYEEALAQGSPATDMMLKHMESRMTLFLSLKAAAFEPDLVGNFLQFFAASSHWLYQIAAKSKPGDKTNDSTYEIHDDPRPEGPESMLQYIPEFLVENFVGVITAIKRYCSETLFMSGEPLLNQLMTFIVAFMGHPYWIHNPHLRANLAECLESFIPKENDNRMFVSSTYQNLFTDHPMAKYQAQALINVFVSIEMTGQSVAFEEKFNYRRPMYEILKYLWKFPNHRKEFLALANKALNNMDSAQTPLFLRFVNFLMNDAIFLLDEGLSYMAQIRENQNLRDSEDWNQLPADQRAENERNTQQMSMLARFHNLLGSKTIETLSKLTKEIPNMFTHVTLVDRMAAMLNHFLVHLVGPKQRSLKVRDMEKYEFRPSDIVVEICTIYLNLNGNDNFAFAIASDGRSYNVQLFEQACNVLSRINQHSLTDEIKAFSEKVKLASEKRVLDEDLVADAPEEFLDPIMSNIMVDPVTLPSSQIIVDRSTIARHLLSDQTDPFNRQPLTMEQVIKNDELRNKIELWIQEKRVKRSSS